MNSVAPIKPRRSWYLLALFIFLLGPILSIYLIYSIFTAHKNAIFFTVPGTSTIYIGKPGQYTLWSESRTTQTNMPNELKNIMFTFVNTATHKEVTLVPYLGWHESNDHTVHYSLGSLYFDKSGTYQVTATTSSNQLYRVYLREPSLQSILTTLFFSIFWLIICVILGILLAIVIFIKRIGVRTGMQSPIEPKQISNEGTTWAMVCHLSGFAGFLFPLANIIVPLLIWAIKRNEYPYVDDQGKEAINFQISVSIYYVISVVLILIIVGLFLLPLLAALQIIAMIIAAIECAHGKPFRYPLCIRFLR